MACRKWARAAERKAGRGWCCAASSRISAGCRRRWSGGTSRPCPPSTNTSAARQRSCPNRRRPKCSSSSTSWNRMKTCSVCSTRSPEPELAIDPCREHDRGFRAIHPFDGADAIEELVHFTHGIRDHNGDEFVLATHRVEFAHLRERPQRRLDAREGFLHGGDHHLGLDLAPLLLAPHPHAKAAYNPP